LLRPAGSRTRSRSCRRFWTPWKKKPPIEQFLKMARINLDIAV
jgi:hypothetical protein